MNTAINTAANLTVNRVAFETSQRLDYHARRLATYWLNETNYSGRAMFRSMTENVPDVALTATTVREAAVQAHLDCYAEPSAHLRDLLGEWQGTQPDDYDMSLSDFERIQDAVRYCVEQEKREDLADAVQTLTSLRADLEELGALRDRLDEFDDCDSLNAAVDLQNELKAAAADI